MFRFVLLLIVPLIWYIFFPPSIFPLQVAFPPLRSSVWLPSRRALLPSSPSIPKTHVPPLHLQLRLNWAEQIGPRRSSRKEKKKKKNREHTKVKISWAVAPEGSSHTIQPAWGAFALKISCSRPCWGEGGGKVFWGRGARHEPEPERQKDLPGGGRGGCRRSRPVLALKVPYYTRFQMFIFHPKIQ